MTTSTTLNSPAVLPAGDGEQMAVLLDTLTEKTLRGSGSFEMFEIEGPVGSGPPPHAHPWGECFYVVSGAIDADVDGVAARAGAGSVVRIPAGTVHTFVIAEPGTRFLSVTDGHDAGTFFRDLSTLGYVEPGPDTLPAIVEVAKRNRLSSPLFD